MRIAFTVHKFPPESLGGTEVYTWSLARALAAEGHDVHVFYPLPGMNPAGGDALTTRDGINLWRVPLPPAAGEGPVAQYWHTFRNKRVEAEFARLLATVRPEIVHFQHVQGVSARLIGLARGVPRVVTFADYWYFCANSQLVRPDGEICDGPRLGMNCVDCATARADLRRLRALRPLVAMPFVARNVYLRRLAQEIDLFIAPSAFLREQYIKQGFPGARIQVMEYGLDLDRLQSSTSATLPPPPGKPHFGFLGSLAWQKGVHVLVEAFNQVAPAAGLTIYGGEHVFPDYSARVKSSAAHPNVRFAGALDYRSLGAALKQIDCLVIPSIWYENSPLVIQEAFGMGVPVVASRLGGMAEKVRDGETGRLFAPGDPDDLARVLNELAADPAQLLRYRSNIHPAPSMTEHGHEILALYRSLVNHGRQDRRPN